MTTTTLFLPLSRNPSLNNGHNGQIKVDLLPSDSIYFIVGIINKKLDVNKFQNVHSCCNGLSDSCLGSLKRGIQLLIFIRGLVPCAVTICVVIVGLVPCAAQEIERFSEDTRNKGSNSPDGYESIHGEGAETDEDKKHQSEKLAGDGASSIVVDKEKCESGKEENISSQGTDLLMAVRKRSLEEGQKALKLGVLRGYGEARQKGEGIASPNILSSIVV
ncbi:unnamed protein product [Prunus armeniaca]